MKSILNTLSILAITSLAGSASTALAHPGHDHFDFVPRSAQQENVDEQGEHASGPVTFSAIHDIEQTSTLEMWAGLRFKALYHLTITGKRGTSQRPIRRTFTFNVASDSIFTSSKSNKIRSANEQAFKVSIQSCKELAEKAMSKPGSFELRVENRGREKSACRLIKTMKPPVNQQPATVQQGIAKVGVSSSNDSV